MSDEQPDAGSQLRRELFNVIRRYGKESAVTVYQAIGALEIVKADLIDGLSDKPLDPDRRFK